MATGLVAKPNEEQPKRLPNNLLAMTWAVPSAVLSGRMMKRMRWGQRTLQPLQAIVALTDKGNLNVDVAGKTPLSDWRRIDR